MIHCSDEKCLSSLILKTFNKTQEMLDLLHFKHPRGDLREKYRTYLIEFKSDDEISLF